MNVIKYYYTSVATHLVIPSVRPDEAFRCDQADWLPYYFHGNARTTRKGTHTGAHSISRQAVCLSIGGLINNTHHRQISSCVADGNFDYWIRTLSDTCSRIKFEDSSLTCPKERQRRISKLRPRKRIESSEARKRRDVGYRHPYTIENDWFCVRAHSSLLSLTWCGKNYNSFILI